MDYNTQRKKLLMPEYGRHVQKMIDYVISIPDKDKRNEQIRAVLNTMGILNPQLRDINDFHINFPRPDTLPRPPSIRL